MSDRDQISLREALRSAIWGKALAPEQMARVEAVPQRRNGRELLGIIDGMVQMNNI